jgi:hypothetical protein
MIVVILDGAPMQVLTRWTIGDDSSTLRELVVYIFCRIIVWTLDLLCMMSVADSHNSLVVEQALAQP